MPTARGRSDDEDFTEFLNAVITTALVLFTVQTLTSLIIANWLGATISLELAYGVVPYLELLAGPSSFVRIATWSTVVTVAVMCLRVMVALVIGRTSLQALDGRGSGLIMAGLLIGYQLYRHLADPPLIDTWVFAQASAGVAATTVIFLGFRPEGTRAVRKTRPVRETRPVRTTRSIRP